jgi:hypothetical protein
VEELDSLRAQEDAHLRAVLKEAEALKKVYFKKSQQLYELRQKERSLISDIAGGHLRRVAAGSTSTMEQAEQSLVRDGVPKQLFLNDRQCGV